LHFTCKRSERSREAALEEFATPLNATVIAPVGLRRILATKL
jgi:hypothetical protein